MRAQMANDVEIGGTRRLEGGLDAGQPGDRSCLNSLTDEELVDKFLAASGCRNVPEAHDCFESLISRYRWLINHVVRSSRWRLPPWDSADDVICRAVFKVYKGLSQWRRQGKLGSFIARIATSELIDTVRRVHRDKAWESAPSAKETDCDDQSVMETIASPGPSPEAEAALGEQRVILARLLGDVCKDWKDSIIVNEYIINGIGAKQIADRYGMTEDLVYQRARRLKVRLLKWLSDRGITSADQFLTGTVAAGRA
jgi:RNA polymerase sigma factor (sigma-70 family)